MRSGEPWSFVGIHTHICTFHFLPTDIGGVIKKTPVDFMKFHCFERLLNPPHLFNVVQGILELLEKH